MADKVSGAFVRSRRHNLGVILVNTVNKSAHHQRFTLAHELGHLVLHESEEGLVESLEDCVEERQPSEVEADTFAAELLVPLKEIDRIVRKELKVSPSDYHDRLVVQLAELFGVSHHVILRRLRIIGQHGYGWVVQRRDATDWNAMWRQYAPASHPDTIPADRVVPNWHPEGVSDETAVAVSRLPDIYRKMAFEAYREGKITGAKLAEV
ncbi:MAG: ImmA/IrrE family metallo-endopeptidase, partial [Planctomycetota bacterium]